MKTTNSNRKKIGFVDYEQVEVQEVVNTTVENINTTEQSEVELTPAHQEVITRISLTTKAISSRMFKKLKADKKQEFYDELVFLTELNTQLFVTLIGK